MPATHIYIKNYNKTLLNKVDYAFLGAWNFKEEIFKKKWTATHSTNKIIYPKIKKLKTLLPENPVLAPVCAINTLFSNISKYKKRRNKHFYRKTPRRNNRNTNKPYRPYK